MSTFLQALTSYHNAELIRVNFGAITPYTVKVRMATLHNAMRFYGAETDLKTVKDITPYLNSLLATNKPVTIKSIADNLNHFFGFCLETKILKSKPKCKMVKVKDARRGAFTYAQLKTIIRYTRETDDLLYYYTLFVLFTGCRPGAEVLSVRWGDITFAKYPIVHFPHSKTKAGAAVARPAFNYFFKRYKKLTNKTNDLSAKLFPISNCAIAQRFSRMLKTLGIDKDSDGYNLSAYSLRHVYITHMLRNNTNIYALATNTRTSLAMIQKHYSHVRSTDFAASLYSK
jgi:integrase